MKTKTQELSLRDAVDYETKANGLSMYAEYVDRITKQEKGDVQGWECDVWNCTIRLGDKSEDFEFNMGIGHNGKMPELVDVMYSVLMDASAMEQSFTDFCEDFGYDTDSRKALGIYRACKRNGKKLMRLIGKEKFEALRYLEH